MSGNEPIYYALHKDNLKLVGCVDLQTIDNDEPAVKYLQENGDWSVQTPQNELYEELKQIESNEWDIISQVLVDMADYVDGDVVEWNLTGDVKLLISFDGDLL